MTEVHARIGSRYEWGTDSGWASRAWARGLRRRIRLRCGFGEAV